MSAQSRGRLRAPFPWFGGKSRAADLIWQRLGNVPNYVEPFAGSLAVLLLRPHAPGTETVNDLDCYVVNFWRAVAADPEAVARYADWPVTEADQHARHQWLVDQAEFRERMNTDPDYYDPKVAGWWVWGLSVYIGDGWCDSRFWRDPRQLQHVGDDGNGVHRPIPHVGGSGRGVNRKIMPLDDSGKVVNRSIPHLSSAGMGVNRKLPNLSTFGGTRQRRLEGIVAWMEALADRLRFVRVCCGDWKRVLTPSVTTKNGLTGVLLDPPYLSTKNQEYAVRSDGVVAEAVAAWAAEHGDDPLFRIALCGYEGDYTMPSGWVCVPWKGHKGYQRDPDAGKKERIWFSPHCLKPDRPLLWEQEQTA